MNDPFSGFGPALALLHYWWQLPPPPDVVRVRNHAPNTQGINHHLMERLRDLQSKMDLNDHTQKQEISQLTDQVKKLKSEKQQVERKLMRMVEPNKQSEITRIFETPFPWLCYSALERLADPVRPECDDPDCEREHDLESDVAKFFGLIINAEESIDLCMFDLHHRQICYELCKMVIQKPHLKLRFVVDMKVLKKNVEQDEGADREHIRGLFNETSMTKIEWRAVNPNKGFMHNKFAIIDRKHLLTGSANWTNGLHSNYEVFEHSQVAGRVNYYQRIFDRLFNEVAEPIICVNLPKNVANCSQTQDTNKNKPKTRQKKKAKQTTKQLV